MSSNSINKTKNDSFIKSKIFNNFKQLDFLSQEFSFEYNDSKIYKTNAGAIISSITFIFALILSFMFGKEVYQRKIPSVSTSEEVLEDSTIHLNNFPIIVQLVDNNGINIDNFKSYFDLSISSIGYDENKKLFLHTNFTFVNCAEIKYNKYNHLVENFLKENPQEEAYCLNTTDPYSNFKNSIGDINASMMRLVFSFCDPNIKEGCMYDADFLKRLPVIAFYHLSFYVDNNNYSDPIREYLKRYYFLLNIGLQKVKYFYFANDYYESDDGWLLTSNRRISFVNRFDFSEDINVVSDLVYEDNYCLSVHLRSGYVRNKINRSYMKIQDLFAKVGGIANVLFILIKILSYHYLRFVYLKFIREISFGYLNCDIINEANINNQSSNKVSSNDSNCCNRFKEECSANKKSNNVNLFEKQSQSNKDSSKILSTYNINNNKVKVKDNNNKYINDKRNLNNNDNNEVANHFNPDNKDNKTIMNQNQDVNNKLFFIDSCNINNISENINNLSFLKLKENSNSNIISHVNNNLDNNSKSISLNVINNIINNEKNHSHQIDCINNNSNNDILNRNYGLNININNKYHTDILNNANIRNTNYIKDKGINRISVFSSNDCGNLSYQKNDQIKKNNNIAASYYTSKLNSIYCCGDKYNLIFDTKSDLDLSISKASLSYFIYLINSLFPCCYKKQSIFYKSELNKVSELLNIKHFQRFLIKSYYKEYKANDKI